MGTRAARICRSGVVWPGCRDPPDQASPAPGLPRPSPWLMDRQERHADGRRQRAPSVGWRCIACWRVRAMPHGIDVDTGCGREPLHGRLHLSLERESVGVGLPFPRRQPVGEGLVDAGGSCRLWLRDSEPHLQSSRPNSLPSPSSPSQNSTRVCSIPVTRLRAKPRCSASGILH